MAKATTPENPLEDEWYHVRYSGEIPEVALHSSIHYLTEDPEGPGLSLSDEDLHHLHEAVLVRYHEIIVRDLSPENIGSTIYRGVLRSIANWRRMKRFSQRHKLGYEKMKKSVGQDLLQFLEHLVARTKQEEGQSPINCSFDDLTSFALELDVSFNHIESGVKPLCLDMS